MKLTKYANASIATIELLLVFPAVLFMTALFMRNVQPEQYEPAHSAQQIVNPKFRSILNGSQRHDGTCMN